MSSRRGATAWPPRQYEPVTPLRPPDWTEQAVCAEVGSDFWVPEKGESSRQPKNVCRGCPVRVDCLRHALDRPEEFGVWGGMSCEERELAAVERAKGTSLEDIIAAADADWDARTAAAAERSRELSRKNAAANRAAVAARKARSPQPE